MFVNHGEFNGRLAGPDIPKFMKPEYPLPYLKNPTNESYNQPVESWQLDMPHSNILLRSTASSPGKILEYLDQVNDH
jgi:hypothetical protein